MIAPKLARTGQILRGLSVRQIRIVCGLILFAYLISHFLNHALGNISLEALAWGLRYHLLLWHFLPVAIILYAALVVHGGLGIWALYERRQFKWKAIEPLQLVLGLSIPLLAAAHVIGTRLGHALFGQDRFYLQVLHGYLTNSFRLSLTLAVLIVAWVHGSIGLYFWLRMKTFFKPAAPFLLAAAVLVPTLALLGVYQSGRMVARESADPAWQAANLAANKVGTPAEATTLDTITDCFLIGYLGLLGLVLAARGLRALRERRSGMITLSYGNGRTVRVPKGLSVLEASLRHQVPHASVCGGRARCSTCRIRGDRRLLAVAGAVEPRGLRPQRGRQRIRPPRSGSPASFAPKAICPSSRSHAAGRANSTWPVAYRRGALPRQHVRRYARFDAAGGKPPAVRHGVHRQPLPRRGVEIRDRMRRPAQPVPRRRATGPVRIDRRSPDRLSPGAEGGGAHFGSPRGIEPVPQTRPARADPLRASAFTAAR